MFTYNSINRNSAVNRISKLKPNTYNREYLIDYIIVYSYYNINIMIISLQTMLQYNTIKLLK